MLDLEHFKQAKAIKGNLEGKFYLKRMKWNQE